MIKPLTFAAMLVAPLAAQAQDSADWKLIYEVVSHPRCANCHTADERPRWFDEAQAQHKIHGMNVQRGADGFGNTGLRCAACHQSSNSATQGGPPGAPHWHLAPVQMAWLGKSSSEICAQFKDPALTGGRDLAKMAEHVKTDALVAWGWAPGGDRAAAPHSANAVYDAILRWQKAGAPCPAQ
jgi:hypothetical protein